MREDILVDGMLARLYVATPAPIFQRTLGVLHGEYTLSQKNGP